MSYFSNRLQYVQMNNIQSQTETVKHGVPQGSVLKPKMFTLNLNIFIASSIWKCMFADLCKEYGWTNTDKRKINLLGLKVVWL